jgi:signal transduction histidine kinase
VKSRAETRLVALVVAVSLALTGLTVWAVYRQGRALREREVSDLKGAALAAASQREAALLADLQRAGDTAGRLWQTGATDDLDVWAADQRTWFLVCILPAGQAPLVFPRTLLEQPLPSPPPETQESGNLTAALNYFRRLATSSDPLTRAGALIASATYEQQLGHPLAAARIFAEAADVLRRTPGLARFAFRAELQRIDSLIAAGEHERARELLAEFLKSLLGDHPAHLGATEIARLQQPVRETSPAAGDPLADQLAILQQRAQRRAQIVAATTPLLQTAESSPSSDSFAFTAVPSAPGELLIVATRTLSTSARLAIVAPAHNLLTHYFGPPAANNPWQVALPDQLDDRPQLARLGPAFASAVLVPAPASAARLRNMEHRQLAVLVLAAAGAAGAWVLVIWMMTRVVARQRQLAHLQSRFVADVSHELKTPLALIRLLAETMAAQRVRDPDKMRSYHETITRESERLSSLLDNILDLGRIESGRKKYEFAECDLARVARQAWSLFEPQFAQDGFDARLDIAPALPTVRADGQALQQVLVNLLQNAHRYGRDGKYVRLTVAREGYLIVLAVEDHGIGMSRAELDRLGESFFRADDAYVRQTRGAGLGLAIVNHIVTAHHGKIEVHSRPGQGSKFTVWIPCAPDTSDATSEQGA